MRIRKPRGMSSGSIFFACGLGLAISYYTWYPAIEAYHQVEREKKLLEAKIAKEFKDKEKSATQTGAVSEK